MKTSNQRIMRTLLSKRALIVAALLSSVSLLYGQQEQYELKEPQAATTAAKDSTTTDKKAETATSKGVADTAASKKATYSHHEFSLWGAGGLSALSFSPNYGDLSKKLGGAFGIGYTYYFAENWGVLIGAEYAFYNSRMKVDGLVDYYDTYDADNNAITYKSKINDYDEKERMQSVNIPLAAQFQSNGTNKFFAMLGFKLGIPVSGNYQIADGASIKTSGYYKQFNQELFDQRDLGYGTFEANSEKEKINFKMAYMITLEAGMKWHLSQSLSLYTGAYFDYAFNDIVKDHDNKFVDYNQMDPSDIAMNSALNSEYTRMNQGTTKKFADRVSPISLGIKLRLGVNLDPVKKEEKKKEEEKKEDPNKDKKKRRDVAADAMDDAGAYDPTNGGGMDPDLKRVLDEYGDVKKVVTVQVDGYEIDQSVLTPRMEKILDKSVSEMKYEYGTEVLVIAEGHTCDLGSDEYNMILGQKRANVVRSYLIGKGYNPDNVIAISKGETTPIVANSNEANRRKNRRVVLIVRDNVVGSSTGNIGR